MLKISEFAKLANTTRRTLIFYDEKGIFHPVCKKENGYRYYEADQLYQFELIAGLRQLGLSLEEVQELFQNKNDKLDDYLKKYQEKLKQEIKHLKILNQLLEERKIKNNSSKNLTINQVTILYNSSQEFWCSDRKGECLPEDIARMYASFMAELGELQRLSQRQTGFLTDLNVLDAEKYMASSFRFIEERKDFDNLKMMSKLEKPAGYYLTIKIENTLQGIIGGLISMREYVKQKNLKISDFLWQLNCDSNLVKNASSAQGILQYQILEE